MCVVVVMLVRAAFGQIYAAYAQFIYKRFCLPHVGFSARLEMAAVA